MGNGLQERHRYILCIPMLDPWVGSNVMNMIEIVLLMYFHFVGPLYEEDLDVLVEALSPVQSKWKALGQILGVSKEQLETFQPHTMPADGLRKMLELWLPTGNVDWGHVLDALKIVGEECLCSELKAKYGESSLH